MPGEQKESSSIISIRPRVIRLGQPVTQMVYQLSAFLVRSEKDNLNNLIRQASAKIMDWVQEKYPGEIPRKAWEMQSALADRVPGQKVECVAIPDEGKWTVRLEQPDASILGRSPVAGRFWTTDISLSKEDGRIRLGTRVVCASPPDRNDDIFLTRPRFIKDLVSSMGIESGIPLAGKPYITGTHFKVDQLVDLLNDVERTIPVVVISEPDWENRVDGLEKSSDNELDGDGLALKLVGYAHVVLLPLKESGSLAEKLGSSWTGTGGAVRTYLPGMDPEKDPDWVHTLTDFQRILAWPADESGKSGVAAFEDALVREIQEANTKARIRWTGHPFVPELKLLENRKKQAVISKAIRDSRSEAAKAAQMSRQLEAKEEENAMLRDQKEKAEKDADEFAAMAEQYEKDARYYEGENSNLRAQLHILRDNMEAMNREPIDQTIHLPESISMIAQWAGEHLTGRLVLLPRAVNALKDAEYEDPEKLARAMLLLANEYRNMRIGKLDQRKFSQSLNRLHFRMSQSISPERAGEFDDEYFVYYPVGSSHRTFLEHHLRCLSNSRDPRRCLAVYFFWDGDTRQVVVGWLPGHLRCKLT